MGDRQEPKWVVQHIEQTCSKPGARKGGIFRNTMFQLLLKGLKSPFSGKERLLKSNYVRKPKLCWRTLNAACSYEPFLQLSLLSAADLGFSALSQCLSLPCWSLWKKIPTILHRRRNLFLRLSRRWNPFLAYAYEWMCTFNRATWKKKFKL